MSGLDISPLLLMSGADRAWARARDARVSAIKEFLLCYKVIKVRLSPSTTTGG